MVSGHLHFCRLVAPGLVVAAAALDVACVAGRHQCLDDPGGPLRFGRFVSKRPRPCHRIGETPRSDRAAAPAPTPGPADWPLPTWTDLLAAPRRRRFRSAAALDREFVDAVVALGGGTASRDRKGPSRAGFGAGAWRRL